MTMRLSLAIVLTLACAACTSNRSYVKDTLAKLPSGDEIAAESEVEVVPAGTAWMHQSSCHTASRSGLVWRRVSPNQTLLAIEGQGEMFVRERGKVLAERGDVKAWHQKYGQSVKSATLKVSADGDRAWLVLEGRTIVSFDYQASVAYFGDDLQPAWAVPTAP